MVAARIGKEGYIKQFAGYNTHEDDTRIGYVSWAIFEVHWGVTKHRDTDRRAPDKSSDADDTCVCVYTTLDKSMLETLLASQVSA